MTQAPPQILVVEDEPLIRMLACDMLEVLGYASVEAGNGAEALAVDDLRPFTALIVDLGLPDMAGEDVVRQLLQKRPDLPVIVTTGSDATAALARIGARAVITVLEKPYQLNDLEAALGALATAG